MQHLSAGFPALFTLLALGLMPGVAGAIQRCELNGEHVNPANGHTTAGKSGLMRCREGDSGPVVREQELRNGAFVGVVRHHDASGKLQREFSVNARGNKEGRSREFSNGQLVAEETYRNGSTVGVARRWRADGSLQRVSFHGDDGREQARAEFTPQGKLSDLRCSAQPQLAPHADDATWCGHRGSTGSATLHAHDGRVRGTLQHERGERRKSELLWASGKRREQAETTPAGGVERQFHESGNKLRERLWVFVGIEGKAHRATTLEREYHESGPLVRERHWKPTERGGELQLEQHWYLNGQLKNKQEYLSDGGQPARRDTFFHDNGRVSHEGLWKIAGRHDRQPSGVHRQYDTEGRLRLERHHDARGRITREREIDASGRVMRDDELFEDGSRKAFSAR